MLVDDYERRFDPLDYSTSDYGGDTNPTGTSWAAHRFRLPDGAKSKLLLVRWQGTAYAESERGAPSLP
jgi:hypothetical protein